MSDDHTVVADNRPGGQSRCFYCSAPVGSQHNLGCVCRSKYVVVDVTFRMVRAVPEDWDAHMIEFAMNESSSCASNLLHELTDVDTGDRCACDRSEGVFVREATKEDVARYGVAAEGG